MKSMHIIIQTIVVILSGIILVPTSLLIGYGLVHLFVFIYSLLRFNDIFTGSFISVGTLGIIMSIIGVIYHIRWKKNNYKDMIHIEDSS